MRSLFYLLGAMESLQIAFVFRDFMFKRPVFRLLRPSWRLFNIVCLILTL